VEYQLLLMKLAGVDGVLIDWPGTTNAFDYVRNRQKSEAFIQKVAKVGLEFAVVYEDHNLTLVMRRAHRRGGSPAFDAIRRPRPGRLSPYGSSERESVPRAGR
jgi:hypothetical protein